MNNLPGNTLFWFFDQRAVISYSLLNVGDDQYPLMLSSPPELADVVSFEILEASLSVNVANTNFISTMRANLSSLREAGVTNITCGNRGTRSNGYLLDFDIGITVILFATFLYFRAWLVIFFQSYHHHPFLLSVLLYFQWEAQISRSSGLVVHIIKWIYIK